MTKNIPKFLWQLRLRKGAFHQFPAADSRPVIGITANFSEGNSCLSKAYYESVIRAGGTPLLFPPTSDTSTLINMLDRVDGVLFSGGADVNPLFAEEEPLVALHGINAERDLAELYLARLAYHRQLPMLGICRGIQLLAMALDGKVEQDLYSSPAPEGALPHIKHSQEAARSEATHGVTVSSGSILSQLYESDTLYVNSFHHQAVKDVGKRFCVTAMAPDGVIEAMESSEMKPIMGVQWHPECMEEGAPIFQWLVEEARLFKEVRKIHDDTLTLDTHCDTPMFFPSNINFAHRDERILVDLHKMTEGHLDATIMVAYLPQPKEGESFTEKVFFDVSGPRAYADLIFDKIEEIAAANAGYLSIAHTPDELYTNKIEGKKSIMLGIENGLALEGDIRLLEHFKSRGVVYITLCHNGDNDICDSARGSNTHGGVSAFGEQVIREMNRQGIMVDLSHASEQSFYDALSISSHPIVCSHSSARALCDHPRNLTDDQMRDLARKGGVAQTTLYPGFLCKSGEASVLDAVAHLEHAIDVMGIDHVGIGTDFDGDGGVRGMADASEALNFTRHLLRKRFSKDDLWKIWGGNFLRVMKMVQQSVVVLLALLLFTTGCKGTAQSKEEEEASAFSATFEADSAYAFCAAQCQFGPRTMNSEAHDRCERWITSKFQQYGLTTHLQRATLKGYDGTPLKACNIIASIRPEQKRRLLICAHWDSRPWADNDPDSTHWHTPVMAANDGASGVAVMIELARVLKEKKDSINIGIDFICFDAEDWGTPQWATGYESDNTWALGSTYWAAHPHQTNYSAEFGILLDMVGGQGASFYKEGFSLHYASSVVERVWTAAAKSGYGSYFPHAEGGTINDDHVPLNEIAKLPTIDVIPYYPDCQQSSFGPTWHTIHDTMEHIDRNTLKAVGQTLLTLIASFTADQPQP